MNAWGRWHLPMDFLSTLFVFIVAFIKIMFCIRFIFICTSLSTMWIPRNLETFVFFVYTLMTCAWEVLSLFHWLEHVPEQTNATWNLKSSLYRLMSIQVASLPDFSPSHLVVYLPLFPSHVCRMSIHMCVLPLNLVVEVVMIITIYE